jgi:hypothetical protein
MERLVTVEFGPSRSKRFGKALAEAQNGPGECSELEPGRYRTRFVLGTDSATYTGLARLLERVRHWRATEVCEDDEPVSAFHAKEMAWCASFQLKSFRACRFHFGYGFCPVVLSVPCSTPSERPATCWGRTRPRRTSLRSPSARTFSPCSGASSRRALLRDQSRASRSRTSRQKSGESPWMKNRQAEDPSRAIETARARPGGAKTPFAPLVRPICRENRVWHQTHSRVGYVSAMGRMTPKNSETGRFEPLVQPLLATSAPDGCLRAIVAS